MDSKPAALTVTIAAHASEDLRHVWHWNVSAYGTEHANRYIQLLRRAMDALGSVGCKRVPVDGRPDLHFTIVQPRPRRHGHVIVYRVGQTEVEVLHVFHTAQDWTNKL